MARCEGKKDTTQMTQTTRMKRQHPFLSLRQNHANAHLPLRSEVVLGSCLASQRNAKGISHISLSLRPEIGRFHAINGGL